MLLHGAVCITPCCCSGAQPFAATLVHNSYWQPIGGRALLPPLCTAPCRCSSAQVSTASLVHTSLLLLLCTSPTYNSGALAPCATTGHNPPHHHLYTATSVALCRTATVFCACPPFVHCSWLLLPYWTAPQLLPLCAAPEISFPKRIPNRISGGVQRPVHGTSARIDACRRCLPVCTNI